MYSSPFQPPATPRPWSEQPAGTLATVQLLGDVQTNWEDITPLDGTTTYDAIGRDIRDHLINEPPVTRFQMGDISDGDANLDPVLIKARFDAFDAWAGSYGIPFWKVMGNHDAVENTMEPPQWAAYMGYPGPSYAVDLGAVRVLALGPSQNNVPAGWDTGGNPLNVWVRPFTAADVAWIDEQLTADGRPTILMNHAPWLQEPTSLAPNWWTNVATVDSGGMDAGDLVAVLEDHPHVIAWCHGHTHNPWFDAAEQNTGLLTLGSRQVPYVDAGATYTQAPGSNEAGMGLAVSFYVSVLDDGRTIEVRWRDHRSLSWGAPAYSGKVHHLTAT